MPTGVYTRTPGSRTGALNPMFGKKHSDEHRRKISLAIKKHRKENPDTWKNSIRSGALNGMWKGESVGYASLHMWVRRKLGHPSKCENCSFKSDNPRDIHWANLSHEYKRDLEDWIGLCVSCHTHYDNGRTEVHKVIEEKLK